MSSVNLFAYLSPLSTNDFNLKISSLFALEESKLSKFYLKSSLMQLSSENLTPCSKFEIKILSITTHNTPRTPFSSFYFYVKY